MITLHHCHEARSMRSLWLLHEMGLEFEVKLYNFGRDLRDPAYLAVHPLGRVPCLVDGDLVLFETGAITQYLCETWPDCGLGREKATRNAMNGCSGCIMRKRLPSMVQRLPSSIL